MLFTAPKSAPKKQVRPTAEQPAKLVTKASDEKRKKLQKKVRKLLKQSPKTIQELVALLNVSQGDINRVTTPLVKSGTIERVSKGSKKWQLRQKGSH